MQQVLRLGKGIGLGLEDSIRFAMAMYFVIGIIDADMGKDSLYARVYRKVVAGYKAAAEGASPLAPEQAQALLEWLASDTVQAKFAGLNFEYPVKPGMALDPIVSGWGEFKADPVDIAVAGRRQAEAVMLMNEAGWR
jgi:hypothetical protein